MDSFNSTFSVAASTTSWASLTPSAIIEEMVIPVQLLILMVYLLVQVIPMPMQPTGDHGMIIILRLLLFNGAGMILHLEKVGIRSLFLEVLILMIPAI